MEAIIKTSSWYTPLPKGHVRIGISRGVPRRHVAGYRVFSKLAPRVWFEGMSPLQYEQVYWVEILAPLDPRAVAAALIKRAGGEIPVMCCHQLVGTGGWCHRAMAAAWLSESLGRPVPEFGHETLPQWQHPLLPSVVRRPISGKMEMRF